MSYIEFKNISKVFGDCTACRNISFAIHKSTIHSVIGENGAGKSTLVKILGGIEMASEGQIFLNGVSYNPESAQDAFKNKIAFIHQHFVLAEFLTGLDNLVLSSTANRNSYRYKDSAAVLEKAEALLKRFSWQVDLTKPVQHLSVGEQQRLEILKALMQEPDIIIFDEPTAVLTPQESDDLMKFIIQLKSEGKTIILISHKLNEIKNVSDEITILRQGQLVATHKSGDLSVEQMAELMIGRRVIRKNMVQRPHISQKLFNIPNTSIELLKSEIFGVAGIEGNGQSEFIASLLAQFREYELSYGDITEDRIKLSLFDELNLSEHMLLKHQSKFTKNGFLKTELLLKETTELMHNWDVRPPDINKSLAEFSGGNQQKFVVGRELWGNPDVVLAAHPTRGVDLGAQEKIHHSLLAYSEKEKTVVLVSSDLDEILYLADRYIILNKGRVFGPFPKNKLSEQEIGIYMAGTH